MDNNVSCRERTVPSRCLEPFTNQESHEVQEYGNGCCHVQKKVLLKGISEIAKSKRCPRMPIKMFVFSVCTSGLFYQTWAFLDMYLAYPTTLDTSEEYPDTFIEPAITICNRNRILRQPYCKTYPEECTWEHTTWESFCDSYRRMCPTFKPRDFNFGIPVSKILDDQNASNAFLNAVGPQEDSNMIASCMRVAYSDSGYISNPPCNSSTTVIQVPKAGFPYRCFSLFSLLSKPYAEPSNVTVADGYRVYLEMHPEEHFNTIDSVQAMVVFHDPRKAANPMTEGILLTAGKFHNLFPTMERRESLPPPYASNCMDYLKEWKKNGGSGPLSKDDCIDNCKIKEMVDEYGCVGKTMTYPNEFPICENLDTHDSPEVNRKCASSCRDACEENIYHVTSDVLWDSYRLCQATDEHCKSQNMLLHVNFNRMKIKKFKQIPRIESIELFSYIGGYLGMWLGISLAAVFDLGEIIYDAIDSKFLKRKRNRKTTKPTKKFGHRNPVKKY